MQNQSKKKMITNKKNPSSAENTRRKKENMNEIQIQFHYSIFS